MKREEKQIMEPKQSFWEHQNNMNEIQNNSNPALNTRIANSNPWQRIFEKVNNFYWNWAPDQSILEKTALYKRMRGSETMANSLVLRLLWTSAQWSRGSSLRMENTANVLFINSHPSQHDNGGEFLWRWRGFFRTTRPAVLKSVARVGRSFVQERWRAARE